MEGWTLIYINMPLNLVFCHGIPDRCFKFRGKPMRVCARCFGVLIGQTAALLMLLFIGLPSCLLAFMLMLPMAIDWSVQRFTRFRSTNIRRFTTGLLGGGGVGLVQLKLLIVAATWFWALMVSA